MIFGLILFLTLVYIVVYCWKEGIKAKERYERDEYLKALEHHKKMVWVAKNQPKPELVKVVGPIAENNMVHASINDGYIHNKNLRPLSPTSNTSNVEKQIQLVS